MQTLKCKTEETVACGHCICNGGVLRREPATAARVHRPHGRGAPAAGPAAKLRQSRAVHRHRVRLVREAEGEHGRGAAHLVLTGPPAGAAAPGGGGACRPPRFMPDRGLSWTRPAARVRSRRMPCRAAWACARLGGWRLAALCRGPQGFSSAGRRFARGPCSWVHRACFLCVLAPFASPWIHAQGISPGPSPSAVAGQMFCPRELVRQG